MIKVAAIQMNSTDKRDLNIEKAERFIKQASSGGAELIALPEYFSYLSSEGEEIPYAEPIGGELIERMRNLAKDLGIFLLCGSIPEKIKRSKKIYNTSVLIDPKGKSIGVYRKIHLFNINIKGKAAFQESNYYEGGKDVVLVKTDKGKWGMTICYDLRFPELFRSLTLKGAEIIFVPSAFTSYTGMFHWMALLRARAIENQVYIVAPAQAGRHSEKRSSYGHSAIIDPWGKVVALLQDGEGVVTARLDFQYLKRVRNSFPCLEHITRKLIPRRWH
ncbi:MAG: carbon-nitrogen hydrolase family protein [Acidobacteriota bacterium]